MDDTCKHDLKKDDTVREGLPTKNLRGFIIGRQIRN